MQRQMRATVAALTATFSIVAVATVVEAADEEPITTTTTTEAPPPPVTLEVVIEPEPEGQEPAPGYVNEQTEPTTADTEPAAVATETPATDEQVDPMLPETATVSVEEPTTTAAPSATHEQEAIVTGTQVAVGNSGGNQTVNDSNQPPTGSVPLGTEIDTDNADAIGSRDENIIGQQADVVLTDQAVANILQIALILNIGAALANSGVNGVASSPGGSSNPGQIGTGDARATGMEIEQYVTQAARTEANQEMDDFANQLAVSLWLGLAYADSGMNSVTGTGVAGSGGSVGAGSASAIGNDSLTDIDQRAAIIGSGTSQTDITQRATVMNLGFALANSGLNNISGVASGLLSASDVDDDAIAQDLFAMLLPALLSSYGYGPGAGSVGTGNATAVGNDSETFVKQVAMAASSGDGMASIVQEVLVANMGVAGANTGGNTLGGRYADLDPSTAEAVVKMAAFLASMLSVVHNATGSAMAGLTESGIEIPFGDLVLTVGGMLDIFDTSGSTASGARANIRQISIVLSLGVAKSNTGWNTGITTQVQGDAAGAIPAANAAGDVGLLSTVSAERQAEVNSELAAIGAAETNAAIDNIQTGDVDAGNVDNLVIICQRINAEDVDCLAPPPPPVNPPVDPPATTPTTTPTTVATASSVVTTPSTTTPALIPPVDAGNPPSGFRAPTPSAAPLPSTGGNVDTILWGAALLVLIGGCLVLVRRRKAPQEV